jgi:hypothetical protein
MWKGLPIWQCILLIIALIPVLVVICWMGAIAYLMYTRTGPLNSAGDQPPTACTVQTAEQDCKKLRCISHVWYCDERGVPTCMQNKCMCFYGCL